MSGVIDKQQATSTTSALCGYFIYQGGPPTYLQTNQYPLYNISIDPAGHIETEYSRLFGKPPQPATEDPFEGIMRDLYHSCCESIQHHEELPMTTPSYPINLPYADGTERWYLATYQPREDWYVLSSGDKLRRVPQTFKTQAEALQSLETLPGGASRVKIPTPEAAPLYIQESGTECGEVGYCFYLLQPKGKTLDVLRDSDGDIQVFDTVREARAALVAPATT